MKRTQNTRALFIHYSPQDLQFETDAQLQAFQQALGRQVMYGMVAGSQEHDRSDLVNISIDRELEIVAAYSSAYEHTGEKPSYDNPTVRIYDAQRSLQELFPGRAFVIGAIPRDDGVRYSFHS